MADEPTLELIGRYRAGKCSAAADELFRRYSERVLGFLRPRLNAWLTSQIEPDDVALSVFNCFFRGLTECGFVFRQREDVWRLLAQIAIHKLHNQSLRHRNARRDVACEASDRLFDAVARRPLPAEAVAVYDELEECLRRRNARDRYIVERFVSGTPYEEIASGIQRSQRTVRRVCEQFMTELQQRLAAEANAPGESHA